MREKTHATNRVSALTGFGFLLFIIIIAVVAYRIGYKQGLYLDSHHAFPDMKEVRELQEDYDVCQMQINKLTDTRLKREHEYAVEQAKQKALMDNINQLQVQYKTLNEENLLFKKILAPENQKPGIQINSVQIFPLQSGKYRYSVLLAKFVNHTKHSLGQMFLSLQGIQNDELTQLPFEVLNPALSKGHAFNVQYFQLLEGEINVPEGFSPESIHLSLHVDGKDFKSSAEEFPWLVNQEVG